MKLGLHGKNALVSGGTAGIGMAIANRLADEGCNVVIVGRSSERAEAAAETIRAATGANILAVSADMTEPDDIERAVQMGNEAFGQIDIAVANVIGHVIDPESAGPSPGHFGSVPPSEYGLEFKQLALSALGLVQRTLPQMKARGWGRILGVSSGVARESAWELPHILPNTVRPAAAGVMRLYSRECVGTGVTVNSLLTGSIETERNLAYVTWLAKERGISLDEARKSLTPGVPLRRSGQPDEMATVAAFLCSTSAAGINGQAIPMTGGTNRHIY